MMTEPLRTILPVGRSPDSRSIQPWRRFHLATGQANPLANSVPIEARPSSTKSIRCLASEIDRLLSDEAGGDRRPRSVLLATVGFTTPQAYRNGLSNGSGGPIGSVVGLSPRCKIAKARARASIEMTPRYVVRSVSALGFGRVTAPFAAERALPSAVRGPVECSQGRFANAASCSRRLPSGVKPTVFPPSDRSLAGDTGSASPIDPSIVMFLALRPVKKRREFSSTSRFPSELAVIPPGRWPRPRSGLGEGRDVGR